MEQLAQSAFRYGALDARAGERFETSLHAHLFGQVLPDFSLDERAQLLSAYGDGWVSTGTALPAGHPVPDQK